MRRWVPARSSRDRGAAAVEFALILPVLAALVFGIINYGDILSVRQSVSQAAAEAARAGAVSQATSNAEKESAALTAAQQALDSQGEDCSDECEFAVRPCDPAVASGPDCMFATVVVEHDALIPGFTFGFGGKLRYTASARVS